MIINNKKLIIYLNAIVNSVFKILPLYEENNVGIERYVESLIFELDGLQDIIAIEQTSEYISLLSTLASVKKEVVKEGSKKAVVKREVFKCINIIKNIVENLKEGK